MRLLRECPAIEDKLETAELTLTHLLTAKTFFSNEEKQGRDYSAQKKEEVLGAMAGHTILEAAKVAQTFSPNPMPINEMLKLEITEEGMKNIKHLKGLRAHSKAEMHREVLRRDHRKCTNCGSQYALQRDHRIPTGVDGPDTLANYRLLCRKCNPRAAIEFFGQGKMDPHINPHNVPH